MTTLTESQDDVSAGQLEEPEAEAPRRARWLRKVVLLLVGVFVVYLAAANLLLNTDRGKRLISPRSPRVDLGWSSAYTFLPGLVHVKDFAIEQQTHRLDWHLRLDRANVLINLLALPARRLSLVRAGGEGLECGFEITPPKDFVRRTGQKRRGWILALRNINLEDLKECRTSRSVLTGKGSLGGSLHIQIRGAMELERLALELSGAELRRITSASGDSAPGEGDGGELIAEAVEVELHAHSTPFVRREVKGRGLLQHLSGTLDFDASTSSLAFLNAYFAKADWLDLSSGHGQLRAALELERGVLASQSRVHFKSEDLEVRYLDYVSSGTAELVGLVQGDTPTLAAQFQEFSVRQADAEQPYILGRELVVRTSASHADLGHPPEVDVTVDLPTSRVPDLTAYNVYLPEKAGIAVTGGEGMVSAHLELSTNAPGSARISVASRNLSVQAGELELAGALSVTTELRDADPMKRSFSLANSTLLVSDATIHREDELLEEAWRAEIVLSEGQVELRQPLAGNTKMAFDMTDSRPVLSFFAERKPKLQMVANVLNIKDIGGTGTLAFVPGSLFLDELQIGGKNLRMEGRLCLGEARQGALWARSHGIGASAYFEGTDKRWTVLRPRRWYETKRSGVACGELEVGNGDTVAVGSGSN